MASGWFGIYGPRGMPQVRRETAEHGRQRHASKSPDTLERFAALNLEPVGGTPEQFAEFLKADLKKYAEIAKRAGIQPE